MSISEKNFNKGRKVVIKVRDLATGAAIAFVMVAIKQSWMPDRYLLIAASWLLAQMMPGVFYTACSFVACLVSDSNLYKAFNDMAEGVWSETIPFK